eukprot:scaffold503_cov375-Pinguiococcus_pyrenoidosus.AAC.23
MIAPEAVGASEARHQASPPAGGVVAPSKGTEASASETPKTVPPRMSPSVKVKVKVKVKVSGTRPNAEPREARPTRDEGSGRVASLRQSPTLEALIDTADALERDASSMENLEAGEERFHDEIEWENVLAKQVLTVYTTELRERLNGEAETKGAEDEREDEPISAKSQKSPSPQPDVLGEQVDRQASIEAATPVEAAKARRPRKRRLAKPSSEEKPRRRTGAKHKLSAATGKSCPIWFRVTGTFHPEWFSLAGAELISNRLRVLEERRSYEKYVCSLEAALKTLQGDGTEGREIVKGADAALVSGVVKAVEAEGRERRLRLLPTLWRQLVLTCLDFSQRLCETRRCKFHRALSLMKRGDTLAQTAVQLAPSLCEVSLRAFVHDAYAFYFWRRRKNSAALEHAEKAMRLHARVREWLHSATSLLHVGAVLSRFARHDEAIRCLGQILEMVDCRKLDLGGLTSQKLCLVAVAYHNIALEQLSLRHTTEACVSSQNSRRLARLSLSCSNRFLAPIEKTHRIALRELEALRAAKASASRRKVTTFRLLTKILYD